MLPVGSRKEEAAKSRRLLAWKYALAHIFLLIEMPPFGGRKKEVRWKKKFIRR